MLWQRTTTLSPSRHQTETWTCTDVHGAKTEHVVDVRLGKPVDILSLKVHDVAAFTDKVRTSHETRQRLYGEGKPRVDVARCPVCEHETDRTCVLGTVHDVPFVRCPCCSHVYTPWRPSDEALAAFYADSANYQSTYADPKTQKQRLEWISKPKAEYVLEQYQRRYGCLPKNVLDVGAGSGHFVYQMRSMGIACDGIEVSKPGRVFALNTFGFELIDGDFFTMADALSYDMVTFWGVVEHVTEPVEILRAAHRALREEGMVIAEVPRWESLSTAIDLIASHAVVRHIDPMDHMQCFSDASLATSFVLSEFSIVAAWYFGMDAFELLTQATHTTGNSELMEAWKEAIPTLQDHVDQARFSDFLLYVGVPVS